MNDGPKSCSWSGPEETQRKIAHHDLALLRQYHDYRGLSLSGLSTIVEFGLTITNGSDWLSEWGQSLYMTDVVARQVYAARDRPKRETGSAINFSFISNRGDVDALPACSLLYSVLSLRETQAVVLSLVLDLLLAKVCPGGLALLRAPTQHRLYQFMLPGPETASELNIIPQWRIFELLQRNNFSLFLVQEDSLVCATDVSYTTILANRSV